MCISSLVGGGGPTNEVVFILVIVPSVTGTQKLFDENLSQNVSAFQLKCVLFCAEQVKRRYT